MKTIFIYYILICICLLLVKTQEIEKNSKVSYYKDAAEIKTKTWYDPETKKELAAHAIVTKRYAAKWLRNKIINASTSVDMEFEHPLRTEKGKLIFSTSQLPYYIK